MKGTGIFLLAGNALLIAVLGLSAWRLEKAVPEGMPLALPFAVDDADALAIVPAEGAAIRLERTLRGSWSLVEPVAAEAEPETVLKVLDALTVMRPGDRLSAADLRGLHRRPADFGLAPARLTVTVGSGRRTFVLRLGDRTPAQSEVYAGVGTDGTVYALPAAVAESVPLRADGFRRRQVFHLTAADLVSAEFRLPGADVTTLACADGRWSLVQPARAAAEQPVVRQTLDRLTALRAVDFVWPRVAENGAPDRAEAGPLPRTRLVPYGLDGDEALEVLLRTRAGASERIVFGKSADTNTVYALVQDGTAVVTVDARAAAACRAGRTKFLDARVFPFDVAQVASLSLTRDEETYTLARGTNGLWQLVSPVLAPADPAAAGRLLDRVLNLKQNDRVSAGPENLVIRLETVGSPADATNAPVVVSGVLLPLPADLRDKTVCRIASDTVRRLSVKVGGHAGAGGETSVSRAAADGAWTLDRTDANAADVDVRLSAPAVARLLKALADLTAVGIASVNPAREDFVRCGLVSAAFVITADLTAADAVRRTLMLGAAVPDGGRYAAVGGVDAIFILSREAVADLTVPLTESELVRGK